MSSLTHPGPRCPLLLGALAFAAGILAGQHLLQAGWWWLAAAAVGIVGAQVFAAVFHHARSAGSPRSAAVHSWCRSWMAFTCALGAMAALGALTIQAHNANQNTGEEWRDLTDGEQVLVTGYVVHDGVLRGSGAQRRQSLDLMVESVQRHGEEVRPYLNDPADRDKTRRGKTHPSLRERWSTRRIAVSPGRKHASDRYGCVANAVYSAELLRAAGLPVCEPAMPSKPRAHRRNPQDVAGTERKQVLRLRAARPEQKNAKAPARHYAQDEELRVEGDGSGQVCTGADANCETFRPSGSIRLSIYGNKSEADSSETAEAVDDSDAAQGDEKSGMLPHVYTYGQRLRLAMKLRPPHNFGNPGAFDYAGYLRANGIYALGSVRADRIEVLNGTAGSRFGLWRSRMRRSVMETIHRLWRDGEAGLLDAMLIGERSFIGREVNTAFQRTGIYHILVVSGMNVGILAFVVFWTLRRVRCGEVVATVLTILLACWYAYLAESGAPIMRSVVMLAVYLCTRLLYRDRAMLNAVGAAALALLVIDPTAVTSPSFQLTFLSVLAIGGIAVPLLERTSQPVRRALRWLDLTAYDMSLSPRLAQFRIDVRMISSRVAFFLPPWPTSFRGVSNQSLRLRFVHRALTFVIGSTLSAYEVLAVSAISQVALALPMAWYFHRATVVGLAANVVAAPLTGVLMPASVAAVALGYLWAPLARIPVLITSWSLAGITTTVDHLGGLRAADVRLATPSFMTCAIAAAVFASALLLMRQRRVWASVSLLALAVSAAWIVAAPAHAEVRTGVLEVTSIDVGQAESTLLVTPEGKTLLVDAAGSLGPWQSEFDYGQDVIAPYLWSRGIDRLDAVVITHAHSDHYGGMQSIINSFHPRELWVGPNAPDRGYQAVLKFARAEGVSVVEHRGGDQFEFGAAQISVLSPSPGWQPGPKPKNDDSLVLRIAYGETSALLTADAEKSSEERMMTTLPRTDLLKVAHNGSKTSSTPEFLDVLRPRYAVISVGARNSFGHPRHEVLQRLAERHIATYRTDIMGAVTFYLDGRRR